MEHPVYHLRPHKAVDRNLFIEALLRLGKILPLSDYRYIGFGSYEFDEFKLVYRMLGIEDLHSIEMDSDIYIRQIFNKPYSCISLFNKTCGTYFDEDYEETKSSIIWTDFSVAKDKLSQCQDISNICSKLRVNDLLRITFNAQPSSIPTGDMNGEEITSENKSRRRFLWLKENLGDYFPDEVSGDDLTTAKYPLFLLKLAYKAIYKDLDTNIVPCPICCYTYADNMQMMTITILMCKTDNKTQMVEKLKQAFKGWDAYTRIDNWNEPINISLPALTVHEQIEIAQYPKNSKAKATILKRLGIAEKDLENYWRFARYYPNYQPITL